MGLRGPKPGFKERRAAAKAVADAALALAARQALQPPDQLLIAGPKLNVSQQNNPRLLGGVQLRALAHRWGLARSQMAGLSDEKIRVEMEYLVQRRRDEETS